MKTYRSVQAQESYSLEIIKDWANGDQEWMNGFIELLLIEIPSKIETMCEAFRSNNTKKLAFEFHQLASQIALLGNTELNKLSENIERKIIKNKPLTELKNLVDRIRLLLDQIKVDFKL